MNVASPGNCSNQVSVLRYKGGNEFWDSGEQLTNDWNRNEAFDLISSDEFNAEGDSLIADYNGNNEYDEYEADTFIDNIELDDAGNLWIGSHPKALAFARHQKKQKKLSPSQVIKITLNDDEDIVEEIFLNDGESLSGSSVATIYGNQLLIGPVFDERFLHCQMNN